MVFRSTFPRRLRLSNHRLSYNCHDYLIPVPYSNHFQTKVIFLHCAWHNICIYRNLLVEYCFAQLLFLSSPYTINSFLFNVTLYSGKNIKALYIVMFVEYIYAISLILISIYDIQVFIITNIWWYIEDISYFKNSIFLQKLHFWKKFTVNLCVNLKLWNIIKHEILLLIKNMKF